MREVFADILYHTYGLGFISEVKVTGEEDSTLVEAMDDNNLVVIKGLLKTPVAELEGEFGVGRLSILKGIVDYPSFRSDKATVEIVTQTRGDVVVPEKVVFKDEKGTPWEHRFMAPEFVREQFEFLEPAWTVNVAPTKSELADFRTKASVYSSEESLFTVKTVGGELRFYVGENGGTYQPIETDGKVKFKGEHKWPISTVLSVLKLAKVDPTMSFLDDPRMAALQITLDSDQAVWKYILPAVKA